MIELVIMVSAVLGGILALMQRDLLKAAILTGINGACIAFLYLFLLSPDVALTQAVVGAAIIPVFLALAIYRTQRMDDK